MLNVDFTLLKIVIAIYINCRLVGKRGGSCHKGNRKGEKIEKETSKEEEDARQI